MRTLLLTLLALSAGICAAASGNGREIIWIPDTTIIIDRRLGFDHVRVIDARDTRDRIGWLKTGALNRYAGLVTEDSLSATLTEYARKLIRAARRQQGELVVVLRSFWLEDRKGSEEIGTVHLRADLFRSTGGAVYWHVRSLDTFYETKSGWDVTASVKRLGSQSIADMMRVGSGPRDTGRPYSLEEMPGRQAAALDQWPVYTVETPPAGIYRSVDDFLQLRSSGTGFVMKHNRGTNDGPEYRFYYRNARGRKGRELRPADCFAIYSGSMWYLAHNSGFGRMPRQAREFYAIQPLRGLADRSLAIGMAGLAFGVVGAALASADGGANYIWYVTRLDPEYRRFMLVKRVR